MEPFEWPLVGEFLDRGDELARLEDWWASSERMPINLYGRRRVGKSWLLRRFAHGKPAVLLAARKVSTGSQLRSFADALEPVLGVRPSLPDVASLFRVLFRAARQRRLLAIIDEFPWLLPTSAAGISRVLSEIQAVVEEERDQSRLKLVLCGSLIGQMEALQGERNPLHGRLIPLQPLPLRFHEAALFLPELSPLAQFERFAIAGGMPRYLSALAGQGLKDVVCRQVLDRNAPLWDEARTVLEQELREPKTYFSILQALASGDKELNHIAQAAGVASKAITPYLAALEDMRIVSRRLPAGAGRASRSGQWHLRDAFFRFWFRFVFPYQDDLESGLRAPDLFDAEIAPVLADHVSPAFEDWCRDWTRRQFGREASAVGAWWGPARHDLRRSGERQSEEIDMVGLRRGRVTLLGEVKWQSRKLGESVLRDLQEFKVPALRQAGFQLAADCRTLLFSRAGYTSGLLAAAEKSPQLLLVDVPAALAQLSIGFEAERQRVDPATGFRAVPARARSPRTAP